jgi:hypothetical protein
MLYKSKVVRSKGFDIYTSLEFCFWESSAFRADGSRLIRVPSRVLKRGRIARQRRARMGQVEKRSCCVTMLLLCVRREACETRAFVGCWHVLGGHNDGRSSSGKNVRLTGRWLARWYWALIERRLDRYGRRREVMPGPGNGGHDCLLVGRTQLRRAVRHGSSSKRSRSSSGRQGREVRHFAWRGAHLVLLFVCLFSSPSLDRFLGCVKLL